MRRPHSPFRATLLGCLALLAPAAAGAEGFQTFQGSTVPGGAFAVNFPRPDNNCAASGQISPFVAQKFFLAEAATCNIYSAQSYNGYIHLYRSLFNAANPLNNCIKGNDDGDLGGGSSTLRNLELAAGTYTLVTSGFSINDHGSFSNTIHCGTPFGVQPFIANRQPRHGRCVSSLAGVPDDQEICLQDRFVVAIDNITNSPTGVATPVRTGSTDTGLFWFYNDRNWEVMVKVLNGCAINGHYWVFVGALTNQGYRVLVVEPGRARTYLNTLGNRAAAVADTTAFPCDDNQAL